MKKQEYLAYESPDICIMETSMEGIICQSMKDITFEGWNEDDDLWS